MFTDKPRRRSLLKAAGAMSLMGDIALAFQPPGPTSHEQAIHETPSAVARPRPPAHTIRFAVIGLDHPHINGITDTIRLNGGQLAFVHSTNLPALAAFQKRYRDVPVARSEDEILNDPSIPLVCSAAVPNLRAPLGVRVMRHGKDFLSDKPAITSLDQLDEVRRAVSETGRIFAIMYGRLESRAATHAVSLLADGAIGKVVQTVELAPHRVNESTRPDWFWDPARYGGTLCDLGSHQADEFISFTGSTTADVALSRVANVTHPRRPAFQDFGDMMVHGNRGFGYFRVDWLTPEGLGTYGDERTFILGTDGYIELRKTIDIAGRPGADHLLIVDRKSARHIDCRNLELPFGPQFVSDVVNRTRIAQNQEAALLAMELVLKAQKSAHIMPSV